MAEWRFWVPGVIQAAGRAGTVDLGPGLLDPRLLPVELLRAAYAEAFEEYGPAALTYGNSAGPEDLRACLAGLAAATDEPGCEVGNVLITAGSSITLDLLARSWGSPGEVVVADAVTYDLGRQIFIDRGLRVHGIAMDSSGMDPEDLERQVRALRQAGQRVAFAYLIPNFHNPTGLVMPVSRRVELIATVRRLRLPVVEDDAYADVGLDDGPRPRSIAALAEYRRVVRLRTFSKSLAPGLRLGWLTGHPDVVRRMADGAAFTSGGGLNHLAAVAMTCLLERGDYDKHVPWLRAELKERRDALTGALRQHLPVGYRLQPPGGGFFLWVRPPEDVSEGDLIARADAVGVGVAAGSRFGQTGPAAIRMCFSSQPPDRLAASGARLAAAWRGAG